MSASVPLFFAFTFARSLLFALCVSVDVVFRSHCCCSFGHLLNCLLLTAQVYLHPPKGVTRRMLDIDIAERFIFIGIKGNPPFLHQQFYGQIKLDESFWMLDDGVIEISLQKQKKGEPWSAVFVGHGQMNPLVEQQLSKKLLLERFAEENPGTIDAPELRCHCLFDLA